MPEPTLSATKAGSCDLFNGGLFKQAVLGQLRRLRHGHLRLLLNGEPLSFGDLASPLMAELEILDDAVWGMVACNGSIGAGEAYVHGYWRSGDLTAVTRLFVANLDVLDAMDSGLARVGRPLLRWLHWLNRNSRRGSRRNIIAHYDLGNALFEAPARSHHDVFSRPVRKPGTEPGRGPAQQARPYLPKTRPAPRRPFAGNRHGLGQPRHLRSQPLWLQGDHHHTVPGAIHPHLSTCRRIGLATAGSEVLRKDYRDLQGRYDKLVSIEMIEAVGHRYLPEYFRRCAALLKDDGLMLLQSITIRDQRYEQARRSVDFIQRHVFPGGALPSLSILLKTASTQTPLNLLHLEDFGAHYARTLRHWHDNFRQSHQALAQLSYDETFQRLWEFYLCYCEGGFIERAIGVAQLLFAGPGARRPALLEYQDT